MQPRAIVGVSMKEATNYPLHVQEEQLIATEEVIKILYLFPICQFSALCFIFLFLLLTLFCLVSIEFVFFKLPFFP